MLHKRHLPGPSRNSGLVILRALPFPPAAISTSTTFSHPIVSSPPKGHYPGQTTTDPIVRTVRVSLRSLVRFLVRHPEHPEQPLPAAAQSNTPTSQPPTILCLPVAYYPTRMRTTDSWLAKCQALTWKAGFTVGPARKPTLLWEGKAGGKPLLRPVQHTGACSRPYLFGLPGC